MTEIIPEMSRRLLSAVANGLIAITLSQLTVVLTWWTATQDRMGGGSLLCTYRRSLSVTAGRWFNSEEDILAAAI